MDYNQKKSINFTEIPKIEKRYTMKKRLILINSIFMVFFLALLWNPIRHIIKNHPYEYVYFNELAGGMENAFGNYEMDYYYHSTREASEWILENAKKSGLEKGKKIVVATWHTASVNYFFRKDTADFAVTFARWYERNNSDWDYAIYTVTGIAGDQIRGEKFPPKNTVHTIDVDGKPICIILKRDDKSDLLANQYKAEKKFDTAIVYYKQALKLYPESESIYMGLCECYFNTGQPEQAKQLLDTLLAFAPNYESGNYFMAHYFMYKKDFKTAVSYCKKILDYNPKFRGAYHLLFQLYAQQGDLKGAERTMLDMMRYEQIDDQGINQLISVYKSQQLDDRGAYKKLYKKFMETYEALGKEKEAETYRDLYKRM